MNVKNREGGNVGKRQGDKFGAIESGNVRKHVGKWKRGRVATGKKGCKTPLKT